MKKSLKSKLLNEVKKLSEQLDKNYFDGGSEYMFKEKDNLTVPEVFDVFQKEGFYKFDLNDQRIYGLTDMLDKLGIKYAETSQLGSDITVFDVNSNNIPFSWKKNL